jgi:carbohydrate-selective porin OprB
LDGRYDLPASLRACPPVLIIFTAIIFGLVNKPVAAQEGLFERDRLTGGDWGGVRKQWEDAGVAFGATEVSETLSNPTGGIRQLTIYQGLLDVTLNLDLDKLLNWPRDLLHRWVLDKRRRFVEERGR